MEEIIKRIKILSSEKENVIIAVDGRCASGKTTFSEKLQKELDCNLIHIDDFFLRPEQRTKERLSIPGENIDHERFLKEVLLPLKERKSFSYRPFKCSTFTLGEPVYVEKNKVTIIEGSYSMNKALIDFYDLKIFLTTDKETQLQRILKRNGERMLKTFKERWIPLEESYFSAFNVEDKCDFVIKT